MQIRLTVVRETGARTVIQVDGRLARDGATQLEEACRGTRPGALALDLGNLLTVDDAGVALLRRLAGDGVKLENASPYVALLLQGAREDDTPPSPGQRRPRGEER